MIRLAEYFIVVGYDFDKSKHGESQGKIIQRLPNKDWDDYKFETQVEMFCQPCGWELSNTKKPPTYFTVYLTDTEARSYYLACLSFHEEVSHNQLFEGKPKNVGSVHSSLNKKINMPNGGLNINQVSSGNQSSSSLNSNVNTITQHKRNLSNGSNSASGNGENESDFCQQEDPNLVKPADQYAPKSLILLARHGYFDVLKNCLSIIYSIYMDPHREISLEYVVSNILSSVDVPPIGGTKITFTIGAGDKQVIQPPVCPTLPVTRSCISMLFKHLGMQNVILIYSSLINDQKILLYSRSLNRLTEACHALKSLIYPLKYGNVFIPIIPKNLIDVLSTPTPFLAGVHSQYRPMSDIIDVITVDLDGGSVKYPDTSPMIQLSEPYNTIVIDSLTKILNPDLITADEVYPPPPTPSPDPIMQDKQLRAVFIRLFCRLFAGYRSCLTLTRIRPKPVIHFNQLIFLLLRGLRNDKDEFIPRLLNCMSFGQFIQDRGTPYRVCDVFDEEYDSMTELLRTRPDSLDELVVIDRLAKKLYDNENRITIVHNLPQEAKYGHTRVYAQAFQLLDEESVTKNIITNQRTKSRRKNEVYLPSQPPLRENQISSDITADAHSSYKSESAEPRFVPHGLELDKQIFKNEALSDKNKVIREFVANIFNNHITEALKRRNTIRQDLKNRLIRRIFIDELYRQLFPDPSDAFAQFDLNIATISELGCERKALLEYQQFELINDLMGEALRQEGQNEDSGVGPIIMDLSTKFCTQLNNIRYYSNMTSQIQEHSVWESQKFWINCFCDQVNNEIRQLYLHHSESQYNRSLTEVEKKAGHLDMPSKSGVGISVVSSGDRKHHSRSHSDKSWSHNAGVASQPSLGPVMIKSGSTNKKSPLSGAPATASHSSVHQERKLYNNKMSALDMAAEEMRISEDRLADQQVQQQENSTVYAQILHFINLIVNFRIPLALAAKSEAYRNAASGNCNEMETGHANGTVTGAHNTSHNYQNQQHFQYFADDASINSNMSGGNTTNEGQNDAADFNARISSLETWLKKFVDKTASDNNLSPDLIDSIKSKIEGIIEGHISNLETIYPEVQNIPKVKKVEVTSPVLLPNEQVILINSKESLRCQLLLDGRHERLELHKQRSEDLEYLTGSCTNQANFGNPRQIEDEDDFDALRPLLPAQGALFLTNYRVVFRGAPRDPYQSNKLVCRSFPIASLKSIKKLGLRSSGGTASQGGALNFLTSRVGKARGGENCLDVIRILSNTFQMFRIGLEPEDSTPEIKDELTHILINLRYPTNLRISFNITEKLQFSNYKSAYCTGLPDDPLNSGGSSCDTFKRQPSESMSSMYSFSQSTHQGGGVGTMKHFSGRETLRIVKENVHSKFSKIKGRTSPSTLSKSKTISETESDKSSAMIDDENRNYISESRHSATDSRIIEFLQKQPGYQEFSRLNIHNPELLNNSDSVLKVGLISHFNDRYQNIKSYPALLAVPMTFNEHKLRKVSKNYQKGRLPIITWYSPTTKAYLIRGASFQSKSFMGRLLRPQGGQNSSGANNPVVNQSSQIIRHAAATLQRGFHTMTLRPILSDTMLSTTTIDTTNSSLGGGLNYTKNEHEISASKEHLHYLQELVNISPNYEQIRDHLKTVEPLMPWTENTRQYSIHSSKNAFEKAYKNIKASGEKAKTIKRKDSKDSIASSGNYLDDDGHHHQRYKTTTISEDAISESLLTANHETTASLTTGASSTGHTTELRIVPLYILGEKAVIKPMKNKWEHLPDVELIAIDCITKNQIREAYDLLLKAALPDNISSVPLGSSTGHHHHHHNSNQQQIMIATTDQYSNQQSSTTTIVNNPTNSTTATTANTNNTTEQSHLTSASARWLSQIQNLLELSGAVVDLIELQSASVAVCLEDGWDVTSQIVSLAQVMLDPYYRTIEGFWALIEKDWIQIGHKFQSRLAMNDSNNKFVPVFLQFLDGVHQLLRQFPLSFEFNDFFLRFMAYHHVSNRFYNFKMDSEADRIHWLTGQSNPLQESILQEHSIWHYIQQHHDEWPVFFNFPYSPTLSQRVLRPCTNLCMIHIWEYYLDEDLSSGSVYDLDHFSPSYRKRNSLNYDPVMNGAFNNSHIERVYAVLGLREGCEVRNWKKMWEKSCDATNEDLVKLCTMIESLHCDDGDTTLSKIKNKVKCNIVGNELHELSYIRQVVSEEHQKTSLNRLGKKQYNIYPVGASNTQNPDIISIGDDTASGYDVDIDHNIIITATSDGANNSLPIVFSNHQFLILPTQLHFQTLCQTCHNRSSSITVENSIINTPVVSNVSVTANTTGNASPSMNSNMSTSVTNTAVMLRCSLCNLTIHQHCLTSYPPETCVQAKSNTTNTPHPTTLTITNPTENIKSSFTTSTSHISSPSKFSPSSSITPTSSTCTNDANTVTPTNKTSYTYRDQSTSSSSNAPTKVITRSPNQNLSFSSNQSARNSTFSSNTEPEKIREETFEPITEGAFSGELYKLSQHTFYSNWHKKLFVLDAIRHTIFYYDLKDNIKSNMRRIDLQDITGVRVLTTINGQQKRFPEYGFLELQTDERTYKLASESPATISEWVEKIQTSIQ